MPRTPDEHGLSREVMGLSLLAAGLFLAAVFYAPAAWTALVGSSVRIVATGILGTAAYAIPVLFLVSAFDFLFSRDSQRSRYRLFALLVWLLLAASVISVLRASHEDLNQLAYQSGSQTGFGLLEMLWQGGRQPGLYGAGNIWSGGLLGSLIGGGLERLIGKTGALILLFGSALGTLVAMYRVSLARAVVRTARAIGRAPERVGRKLEEASLDEQLPAKAMTRPPLDPLTNWIEPGQVPVVDLPIEEKAPTPPAPDIDPFAENGRAHWEQSSKPVKRKKPAADRRQLSLFGDWQPPPLSLLLEDENIVISERGREFIADQARLLEEVLGTFKIEARVVNYTTGPTITRYELQLAPGIKVSRIVNLADDIALNLAAFGVRIEAPIPGKPYIGIEIPNRETRPVRLRDLLESKEYQKAKGPMVAALGRDASGKILLCDVETMPHLLIAGATGSGKSVCLNAILISLLYRSPPERLRMLLIDPKVVELKAYNGISHLLQPVVTNPKKAFGVLDWAVREMDRRYNLIAERNVREINAYNDSLRHFKDEEFEYLPHILIVIDELADLMYTTPTEVEDRISRLMAKARAAGIHLIIATQRPSVDVITGVIKANIPSRIAFAVSAQVDSRTILDSGGAEKLLGKGDMLYAPMTASKTIRGQCALVTDHEVEEVLGHIKSHSREDYVESVGQAIEEAAQGDRAKRQAAEDEEDDLLFEALGLFVEAGHATVSLLQRRLAVGHPRAARLVDRMEQLGYIGPSEGSKPRKVLVSLAEYEAMLQGGEAST